MYVYYNEYTRAQTCVCLQQRIHRGADVCMFTTVGPITVITSNTDVCILIAVGPTTAIDSNSDVYVYYCSSKQ